MIEISEKEIRERLTFDNPWWTGRGIDPGLKDFPRRFYYDEFYGLVEDVSVRRAVILMGPRRVGKTVMAYHAIQGLLDAGVPGDRIVLASLETPLYSGMALEQLVRLFIDIHGHRDEQLYVFFDEIQYLKDWEVHLKSLVDSFRNVRFVATGSAAAALKMKSQESGAGRFTDFLLPPLTFAEYLQFIGREDELIARCELNDVCESVDIGELNAELLNYLNYGGYPEAVFSERIRQDSARYIKSDIIDKVLLRDLPILYGIQDIQELNRLFTTLAYNTGQEVTLEELSQSSGVAKNTLRKYLDYLEAAFLIRRVKKVDQNARRFKRVTSFKVYLTNPSMRGALFGYVSEDAEAMGALCETAVYSQWLHSEAIDNLFYARWKRGEVDIVHLEPVRQKPDWAVEVKWSDRSATGDDPAYNLASFYTKTGVELDGLVTTKTWRGDREVRGVRIQFRPTAELIYTLGKNILSPRGSLSQTLSQGTGVS
ncbi:MAG: ATP-binding protein [Bacteroidota bacterium]